MNDSKNLLMILGLLNGFNPEYCDDNLIFDGEVNDCLIHMYVYMMSGEDKHYQEFVNLFDKLNYNQQEYVRNDYINIINAQKENDKIKRKGEMNYE